MFLLDDILLAPVSGFKFILGQIQKMADQEFNDDTVIKEQLLELQMRLRHAALEQGLNVTRPDIVFELAERAGLQMNRFTAAFGSSQTRRLIREEYRLARGRGVRRVPTLVIANRWMISGLRETGEYRELLLACVGKLEHARTPVLERLVH